MTHTPGATQPAPADYANVFRPWWALCQVAGTIWLVLWRAWRPRTWRPTVTQVWLRQVYFTGVGALPIIFLAALAVGVSVVVQAGIWLELLDQSHQFGPFVATMVIQNLGPFLVNFVVIGRSGTAICTELSNMTVQGEVHVLDAQGVDPFDYLVLPRVLGVAVSVFALSIVFAAVALLGGYVFGMLMHVHALRDTDFVHQIFWSLQPLDLLTILAKTVVPGLATGAICCVHGLGTPPVVTAVPQVGTLAIVRAVGALFIVSAVLSLIGLI